MLALCLDQTPRLIEDYPIPERRAGEALVKVSLAGVCDTDIQLSRGYMSYRGVLGHEFVGRVVSANDSRLSGRRVVGDINAGCGRCPDCLKRDGHHCQERSVLGIVARDGAFAEYLSLPERCLVPVPDEVSDERAVFAEPLAAALHVQDELSERPRKSVAVFGDGKLGLLIALSLAAAKVPVTLLGHHEAKLEVARAAGVRTRCVAAGQPLGERYEFVVEATGSAGGLSSALAAVEPRGTIVLKTTIASPVALDLSAIVINEVRLVGSRCGDMQRAVNTLRDYSVDPTPLIAARFPLREAASALAQAAQPGVLKVLIEA